MKILRNIFNRYNFTSLLFYISILTFIIAFNFAHNPPSGWYQQFLPNLNNAQITDITFLDSLTGFAITNLNSSNESYILKTTNGGDNWNINFTNTFGFVTIQFINNDTGFTNAFQTIYKSTNSGENWTGISLPGDIFGEDMFVLNNDTIWLVNTNGLVGGVFRTTNGGTTWQRQLNLFGQNPNSVYMYNKDIGFISNLTILYKTTNSGVNWTEIPGGPFTDIYFADSLTGWKSNGDIKYTNNGGMSWTNQSLPSGGTIQTTAMRNFSNVNKDILWGVAGIILINNSFLREIIYKTTNGGINWGYQLPDTSISESYNYINFINELTGWSYPKDIHKGGIHTVTGGEDTTIISNINLTTSSSGINYILNQNYPNPFNPRTNINYELRVTNYVSIKIYDINGREVKTLVNKKQNQGKYEVEFDGSELSSGVYIYSLFIEGIIVSTRKMVLVR